MGERIMDWLARLTAAFSPRQAPAQQKPAPAAPAPAPRVSEHPHAKAYAKAKAHLGTQEIKGKSHNPEIVGWFGQVGHSWVTDDETAWCAAFAGAMLQLGGLPSTRKLNARSYMEWGAPVRLEDAQPGDIVVFTRGDPNGWQGHVGFFVRRDGAHIIVLGGNQSNAVTTAPYPVSRLLGVRRWIE